MKQFIKQLKHSPGPWHPGHLSDDEEGCQCRYIVNEGWEGGIGEVYVDNGIALLEEGANCAPPKQEAIANMHLMAASPELLDAAIMAFENLQEAGDLFEDGQNDEAWEWIAVARLSLNHAIKKALNQSD